MDGGRSPQNEQALLEQRLLCATDWFEACEECGGRIGLQLPCALERQHGTTQERCCAEAHASWQRRPGQWRCTTCCSMDVRCSVEGRVVLVRDGGQEVLLQERQCNSDKKQRKSRISPSPKGLLWNKFRRGWETITVLVCPMRMTWCWLLALWREWL